MIWSVGSQKTKNDHNNPKIAPTTTKLTNSVLYYILHLIINYRQCCMQTFKIIQYFRIFGCQICTAKKNMDP